MTSPISGIALEGYQVFEKYTFIPLERLTLLFGPNSAGKSTIYDAFELSQLLLNSSATKFGLSSIFGSGFDDKKVSDLLKRHWRRKPGTENQFSPSLKVDIHHTTSCLADQVIADKLGREIPEHHHFNQPDDLQLESKWHFYDLDNEEGGFSFQWDYELIVESNFILGYIGTEFKINLEHPLIKNIPNTLNIKHLISLHPDLVEFKNGLLNFKFCIFGFQPSAADFCSKGATWLHYNPSKILYDSVAPSSDKLILRESISEISLLVGSIILATQGNTNISLGFVDASRMTPTPESLIFELGSCHDHFLPSSTIGDDKYTSLAVSLASEIDKSYPPTYNQTRRKLADDVNRALADHLFIEHGYRLDFEYRVLLSKNNSEAAQEGYELEASEFGYLIKIFVTDNHGRKHRIDDVGSGIGYLLPVLSATYDLRTSQCFVQQPELHIHPALQAALGDVFIEATAGKQIIIETHSESLLLRVLKRIRQTDFKINIANELKIQAQDVCVLYFDPSPSGYTSVRRLRISQDGEFMDRWPRGFFTERDQELLDE